MLEEREDFHESRARNSCFDAVVDDEQERKSERKREREEKGKVREQKHSVSVMMVISLPYFYI